SVGCGENSGPTQAITFGPLRRTIPRIAPPAAEAMAAIVSTRSSMASGLLSLLLQFSLSSFFSRAVGGGLGSRGECLGFCGLCCGPGRGLGQPQAFADRP